MKTGIQRFHRCPYCCRGEGDISIDVEAAAKWQPPPAPRGETPLTDFSEQPVIVFRPDRAVQEPCPHLVYLMVDLNVFDGSTCRLSRTFTWLHPSDPEQAALWNFWEEVESGEYEPSMPYRYRNPTRKSKFQLGEREYRVTCKGHVICAVDTEGFCTELQERDSVTYEAM